MHLHPAPVPAQCVFDLVPESSSCCRAIKDGGGSSMQKKIMMARNEMERSEAISRVLLWWLFHKHHLLYTTSKHPIFRISQFFFTPPICGDVWPLARDNFLYSTKVVCLTDDRQIFSANLGRNLKPHFRIFYVTVLLKNVQ